MEVIDEDAFNEIEVEPKKTSSDLTEMEDSDVLAETQGMSAPIDRMKETAVSLKLEIEESIQNDRMEKGKMTDRTRRLIKDYTDLLDKIQKHLFGTKSSNVHLHAVSHSTIASKIRQCKTIEVQDEIPHSQQD